MATRRDLDDAIARLNRAKRIGNAELVEVREAEVLGAYTRHVMAQEALSDAYRDLYASGFHATDL
jgi:hypothetical protein